jgi:HSP20 family protein
MYQFELKPFITPRTHFEKEVEKMFDGFTKTSAFSPATEVVETEKYYGISMDVPGLSKEDIDIEVKENYLSVTGERKTVTRSEKDQVHRTEKKYGKFSRMFSLPQNVNFEGIEASFENGVLEIILPKEEKTQSKKISISGWKKSETPDIKN